MDAKNQIVLVLFHGRFRRKGRVGGDFQKFKKVLLSIKYKGECMLSERLRVKQIIPACLQLASTYQFNDQI